MLRAVGMSRRQVRAMIRAESVITAAIPPARRAARVDILRAVTTE